MSILDRFLEWKKFSFDDLYNAFLGMERRSQIYITVGLTLFLLILLLWPVSCVSSRLSAKQTEYEDYIKKATEVYGVLSEYSQIQKRFDQLYQGLNKQGKDVLQTLVYDLAEASGIDIKIHRIEVKTAKLTSNEFYEEIGKEVQMRRVPLDQLLSFLNKLLEYDQLPLAIKKLDMKVEPRQRDVLRDVEFVISTIRVNK